MAVAGSGGWIPSNLAILRNGRVEFVTITQNKPRELVTDVTDAAERLRRGEYVTVDVRYPYMSELRELLGCS